jgi:hybrid cluster-associated redox disulfide protein
MSRCPEGRQCAPPITADCLVFEIVERYPDAIPVFARHGLQCAGCYISPFHTLADSAREYALHIEPLLADLNQAITVNGA